MTASAAGSTRADEYGSGGATTGGAAVGGTPERDVSSVSLGEIVGDVTRDLSTLMRQEIELAKAEIRVEVSKTAKGAGMLGGAGFAGYMLIFFLSYALWWGLENVMDAGLAALVVAVIWGIIAAVLYVVGRGKLKQANLKPEQTIETAKQIPDALKGR